MGKENLWNKFSKPCSQVIIYSEAASVDCGVDCLYPESFMVGILTAGANEINSILIDSGVDLKKCLKIFKDQLILKKKFNEGLVPSNLQEIKISRSVIDICKAANKIREEINEEKITISHIFLALLNNIKSIQDVFESEKLNIAEFSNKLKNNRGVVGTAEENKSSKNQSALSAFCVNVTEDAKLNKLDPILAREKEIENIVTILCRRSKNNPILLGEAGVGKTAIIEGIAQRIVAGIVPKQLLNCKLYSLNLSGLVAGTRYRGDFEERIQALVKEIQRAKDCILFIDEIHTLVGAGSAAGAALDASNILKPFLARNDLRCIGATTLEDFKKYFQKDSALTRRFQQVMIEEPTKEQMYQILSGIKSKYEEYHKCIVSEDAVDAIINLTARYLPDKRFPDKAIDCIDMACAKFVSSKNVSGKDKIIIKSFDIAQIVGEQCQIPIEVIMWDDNERIQKIESNLCHKIVGQQNAVTTICRILKNSYSGIRNPDKPIGSFVFGGQSGTGKTYMAKQLAEVVFGKINSLIRLDMSEFSESHSVSKLIGSPPGYVGFQEVDVFVDKIKRKPYSIVLLDELEKAHPDVLKLFLQVMADGIMTDAIGNKVDFKNIILIMTGNFGMNDNRGSSLGFTADKTKSEFEIDKERLIKYCKDRYGAEFVNRVDEFVPFIPLGDNELIQVAKIETEKLSLRLADRKCKLTFSDDVFKLIIEKSKKEHGTNANMLNRIISREIEPCISDTLLTIKGHDKYNIRIDVENDQFVGCKRKIYAATTGTYK